MHTDPPLLNLTKEGAKTVLELRNLMVSLEFCRKGPREILEGVSQKVEPPHNPPPPP